MKVDISVVGRITEQCNFNCLYCYMDQKKNQYMDLTTVENIIRKFQDYNDEIAHFTWIGGEPLLMPDKFFEHIIHYSKASNPKNLEVSHFIQTNGYFLDDKRINFLQNLGFKIGVSYDGSKELQDNLRPIKCGKGTYDKLQQNLTSANKSVGTITVITRLCYGKEREIYQNLKSLTKAASLNFYAPTGFGLGSEDRLLPTKDEAKEMMIRFYEMWRDDSNQKFQLNPFAEIVRSFFNGMNKICEYSTISCYRIIGIDVGGHVYTCSRSTHMPETFMGDVNHQNLNEILNSQPHEAILNRYLKLKEEGCKYFSICSGGCPIEALSHKKDFMDKTYYCCDVKGELFKRIGEDLNNDKTRRSLESRLFI